MCVCVCACTHFNLGGLLVTNISTNTPAKVQVLINSCNNSILIRIQIYINLLYKLFQMHSISLSLSLSLSHTHTHEQTKKHTNTHIYIYMYMNSYIYIYVYLCILEI